MSSADNICKQFGPRSGSKLFDTGGFPERIFLKKEMKHRISAFCSVSRYKKAKKNLNSKTLKSFGKGRISIAS